MAFGPRLPENAPFTPSQRAWLDGYIAGWFSFDIDAPAEHQLTDRPPAAPAEPDDFPWHDPTLSLDERLALAEGRRPERVLMAAMAQLDCGQCGYLCQTCAEAIARGEEKSLSRCVPGGKATSRKLKELMGSGLGNTTAAPAALPAAPPEPERPVLSDKPFVALFRRADCLNGPGSEKETRHVILAGEVTWRVTRSATVSAS
jgi:sulfite reductase (NADPH) flavoprotein alpha-component